MKIKLVKTLSLVLCLGLIKSGYAQTWNNTGSGAWDVAGNWATPSTVPNAATDDVIFANAITAPATVSIPGTFAIRNMSFTAPGFSYTLLGGALNTTPTAGNGITVTGTDAHTVATNLNYLAAYTVTQGSTLPLTVSGAISGSATFAKAGTGELIFSGTMPNTFTGLLTLNAGQVTFNKTAGVLASSSGVTIAGAGAELQLNASEQTLTTAAFTISNATAVLDLNGQSTTIGSLSITTTGTYNLGGTLNLTGTTATTLQSPTAATSPTITGQINLTGVTGGVSKPGAGTFTLQNIGVQNGTHDFAATTGTIDITGVVSGNGALSKSGTGTLNFSGSGINTYAGLTTLTAGTTNLSRSSPGLCIPGDITLAGGTLLLNNAANFNQIADTSNMIINTGTFNMNTFGETISSLTLNGGTITNNTGPGLTLNSTGTALTMRNTTVPGQLYLTGASGGNVVFDAANSGTATLSNVDLGSPIRTFNIADGVAAADMTINGVVSGGGGIAKIGAGTLSFTSTSSNTYTGMTTVSAGTMLLSKTAPFMSIVGDVLINGGTVQQTVLNQMATTSNVQMDSGTFDLNALALTINSFTFNGGTFNQGIGQLSLASTATALTMRNTTVNGTINLTGASGGSVVFDSTNNGIAIISNITLDGVSRVFNIAAGTDSSAKMVIQASSGAGGALIKDGAGVLELTGTHTYTLSTAQVLNGTLIVNGNMTCPTTAVSSGAIVKGAGTVTSNTTFNGTLQPGNSIGTLNFVGAQTFGSTFVLENEFNQTSTDLVNITGSLTISPGAAVTLVPLTTTFTTPSSYTIIQTTTGITGTFTTLNNPLLFYSANLTYNPNSIVLQLTPAPFSSFDFGGNAKVVANYLDQLDIPAGSDLAAVDAAIRQLSTASQVQNALLQIQPSQLKGLALSQENNAFQIESYILERARRVCCPSSSLQTNVWGMIAGDFYDQNPLGEEISFKTNSKDILVGIDTQLNEAVLFGVAGVYTHSSLTWQDSRGKGEINSGSLAAYLNFDKNHFFATGLLLGAYNSYNERRHIQFSTIDRKAHDHFNGCQFLGNLELGGHLGIHEVDITPYVSGQVMHMHMGSIHEQGADSLNLDVFSSNYLLFRGQGGINLSHCTFFERHKVSIMAGLSYIREQRFAGKKFTASLEGYNSTFTVKGMNPNRNAFSPEAAISFISKDDTVSVSLGYDAEIGNHYVDQGGFVQGRWAF